MRRLRGQRKKNVYQQHRKTLLKFAKTRFCPCCGTQMWSPSWGDKKGSKRPGPKEALATVDHIIPRSRGGSDELSNLRLICLGCNHKKGSDLDAGAYATLDG